MHFFVDSLLLDTQIIKGKQLIIFYLDLLKEWDAKTVSFKKRKDPDVWEYESFDIYL
jgi:hypothetical protein